MNVEHVETLLEGARTTAADLKVIVDGLNQERMRVYADLPFTPAELLEMLRKNAAAAIRRGEPVRFAKGTEYTSATWERQYRHETDDYETDYPASRKKWDVYRAAANNYSTEWPESRLLEALAEADMVAPTWELPVARGRGRVLP